jgi:hypothetical protein
MGLSFNESDATGQNKILPYNRGPPAAYLAHLNLHLSNRKMLEEGI